MFAPGSSVDRYRIEAPLGGGGMGIVYRAYDTRLKRPVAIKVVRPELARGENGKPSPATLRLVREARAAAALQHPNVAALYDVGDAGGVPYLVMEFIDGESLANLVGDTRVPIPDRVLWVAGVARALDAAHRAGLVHRDVKPENVMIARDGTVKVLDFGIVKQMTPSPNEETTLVTRTGVMVGTPAYISPEQVLRQAVDGRSDQFSWGILAYELLAGGIHPFSTNNPRNLAPAIAVLNIVPTPLVESCPEVPQAISDAVMRALTRDPGKRFPTLGEAADLLERAWSKMTTRRRVDPAPRPDLESAVTVTMAPRAPPPPSMAPPSMAPPANAPFATPALDPSSVRAPIRVPAVMDATVPRLRPPPKKSRVAIIALGVVALGLVVGAIMAVLWGAPR